MWLILNLLCFCLFMQHVSFVFLFCLYRRLDKMGNEDLRKAEEFVLLMRKHYISTLAVSSDKNPTCGEILPILQKLQQHYTVQEDDSVFTGSIKENIWKDLSTCYQVQLMVINKMTVIINT